MNSDPITCPYCNTILPAPAGASAGQRIVCPRCGDSFTVCGPAAPSRDLQKSPTAVLPAPAAVDLDVERRRRVGRKNRILAGMMLGGMGVMAAVALAYALYTTGERRAHDTAMPPPPRRSPLAEAPAPAPTATPPAALEALRWLPADTTLVAGVQAAELRQTEAGRDLLNHLFRVGKTEINADMLERWTGLKASQIDHVVLGVKADDALPPRTLLVVRTTRPYDADAVKAALHAEPVPDAVGKTVYRAGPRDGGLRPALWFADERTLVLGLLPKHLESVPDRPAAGLERLPAEVRSLLETRLEAGGPAWVVGHSADWRQTGAALLLGQLGDKDVDLLGHVRDFALQLEAQGSSPRLLASVQCDDAEAARALETRLEEARRPNHGGDLKTAREGAWLTVQRWGDPGTLLEDLGK